MQIVGSVKFPAYTGVRCLMMPFIQGEASSVPNEYRAYRGILETTYLRRGDVGYLTIDESIASAGRPHRGARARWSRALHTEAGRRPDRIYCWGSGGGWGRLHAVTLDGDVEILLANNLDGSCAVWDATHEDTSLDGDIGDREELYPYSAAAFLQAGEVCRIGIFTPHESISVVSDVRRQFLRIVSSGVHGREPYFTKNPLMGELPDPPLGSSS